MAQLQHWTVTCTTCDMPAEYHCNTCGDILCPKCREIHERSRATGHHSIVPYSERVEPGKLTGQCDDHPGQTCMVWCQRCDRAACTECVTSDDHEGHKFIKITAKLEGQRKAIKEAFDEHSKLLKQWEDSLQQVQSSMTAYENDVDELGKDITRAADRVCDQVRSTEAALQTRLQDMKKSQTSILKDQEKVLVEGITGIKQQIKETEDKLRSEDVGVLLHYKAKENKKEITKPPVSSPPTLPAFTPGKLDIQSLESMVGSLSMEMQRFGKKKTEKSALSQPSAASTGSGNTAFKEELPQPTSRTTSSRMLPVATVISIIQFDGKYPYLTCTGSGQAWVRTGDDRVQLMDRVGNVMKTINTGFYINGMTFTPQGDLLISDENNKSIKSVSDNGNIKTLFKTKWAPYGICCLYNGDVVVAFFEDGHVIQYSRNGKLVRELGKSLLTHPFSVVQNRINVNNCIIYVCDDSGTSLDSPGRLIGFTMNTGKLEYEYTGSDATKFTPSNVCTDQAGRVFITDYSNHRIHVIDQEGRFLQHMLTEDQGLSYPYWIDTDSDGYAWVSEYNYGEKSKVKILKYTN